MSCCLQSSHSFATSSSPQIRIILGSNYATSIFTRYPIPCTVVVVLLIIAIDIHPAGAQPFADRRGHGVQAVPGLLKAPQQHRGMQPAHRMQQAVLAAVKNEEAILILHRRVCGLSTRPTQYVDQVLGWTVPMILGGNYYNTIIIFILLILLLQRLPSMTTWCPGEMNSGCPALVSREDTRSLEGSISQLRTNGR